MTLEWIFLPSKIRLETPALPPASRPPGGLAARSETIESATYRAYWVPRSRFAVGPRPGCAVFRRQFGPITIKRPAADSRRALASLWSFAPHLPVHPPQRTDHSHGLSAPSARTDLGDRFCCREIPKLPTHPPSGFGCPLDGFIPPIPGRFCFTPAALMGFALRSFPLPQRCPVRFRPSGPTCRLFARFTTPRKAARPARTTAASGLQPVQESLAAAVLLARKPPAAPLGFSPSKAFG
jgi:hypothetical protein